MVVDKPERTQSQILMGQPAPRWADGDFMPLQVATTAFGGTFTARLMNEVRSKRGLSYGASARLGQGRGEREDLVVPRYFRRWSRLRRRWSWCCACTTSGPRDGLSDDEVAFAKGYLANSFAFNVATPEERLDLRVAVAVAGLAPNHAETYRRAHPRHQRRRKCAKR